MLRDISFAHLSAMNANDLFSFLDEVPGDDAQDDAQEADDEGIDVEMQPESPSRAVLKRKISAQSRSNSPHDRGDADALMQNVENTSGPSAPKKKRANSPKPIVLDDFETEAKREVAASAGFTGGVDTNTRLELRHQVCDY